VELILWRHAEAEMGEPDLSRALTAKGHKQAMKMGAWLDRNLPHGCRILSSPSKRTVQTAEALGRKFKILPELGPDAEPRTLLAAANWPDSREPVLIIGHQPTLGQTAGLVLTGIEQDWSIRKATAWWIVQKERGDNATNYLKAIMPPELASK
jgi:phosphohistidine phosphatase